MNKNSALEKLSSVIFGKSVSLSVINLWMNLLTDKARKKNYSFLSIDFSLRKFAI